MKIRFKSAHAPAFSLTETVIAMGVIAVLVTAFVVTFGAAGDAIKRSIDMSEVQKVSTALHSELHTLRNEESKKYASANPFNKAFEWLQKGSSEKNAVVIYTYRGDLKQLRPDGSFKPLKTADVVPGQGSITCMGVRLASDPLLKEDLAARVDSIFVCRLRQLVWDEQKGSWSVSNSKGISSPYGGELISNANDFYCKDAKSKQPWGGELSMQAEFWTVASVNDQTLKHLYSNKAPKPIFVTNLAVRR